MTSQPSNGTRRAADTVRAALARCPDSSLRIRCDGPPEVADSYADYLVEWETIVEPTGSNACPLEIWFVSNGDQFPYVAVGFDRWSRLASRVGLRSNNERFVFGIEPVSMSERQLNAILSATVLGELEASYVSACGHLINATGRLLIDVGLHRLQARTLGNVFKYSSYAA